jgi:hypothetical protein
MSSSNIDTDDLPSMDEYDNGQREKQIAQQYLQYNIINNNNETSTSSNNKIVSLGIMNHAELDLSERDLDDIPEQYVSANNSRGKILDVISIVNMYTFRNIFTGTNSYTALTS